MPAKCLLCGKEFSVVTYTHLRAVHDVTMNVYRRMFPDAELTSKEAKQEMREIMLGNQNALGNHSTLGLRHTEKSKQLMREAAMNNQHALGHTCVHTEETKQAMREAALANWENPNYVRRVFRYKRPNERELQLLSVLGEHFPSEWRYVGDGQVWIGSKNPDFINAGGKKQIIEVFGYYWHSLSNRLGEEELVAYYRSYGFSCIVFWEYDVYDEGEVVRRVREEFL